MFFLESQAHCRLEWLGTIKISKRPANSLELSQSKRLKDSMADDEIDDSLYSRQRYVFGDEAMKAMAKSSVFLDGGK